MRVPSESRSAFDASSRNLRRDFAAALAAFREAVGEAHVYTKEEDVALYRDAYDVQWGLPGQRQVSAAVAPESLAQVQKVMVAANRYRIPIYPIATGMNLGYGGSAPIYPAASCST